MTVLIDKKQIHLGWETATAIIVFLVVTMWGAGSFSAKFLQQQGEMYSFFLKQSRKDSVYDTRLVKVDTVYRTVEVSKADIIDIKKELLALRASLRRRKLIAPAYVGPLVKSYNQTRNDDGQLEYKEVKP